MKAILVLSVLVMVGCGGGPFELTGAGDPSASSSGAAADDAGHAGDAGAAVVPAPGCMPDNTLCTESGSSDCLGWRCPKGSPAPMVPTGWGCSESGGGALYACSPDAVDRYVGDPAGNACVRFPGGWCVHASSGGYSVPPVGSPTSYIYVCPPASTGPTMTSGTCGPSPGYPTVNGPTQVTDADGGAVVGDVWCCE